jgi:methyltransferase-like protein
MMIFYFKLEHLKKKKKKKKKKDKKKKKKEVNKFFYNFIFNFYFFQLKKKKKKKKKKRYLKNKTSRYFPKTKKSWSTVFLLHYKNLQIIYSSSYIIGESIEGEPIIVTCGISYS